MNPLLKYMQDRDIGPFSSKGKLLEKSKLSRVFLGRIATDQRRCTNATLQKIEEATDGEVPALVMLQYWLEQDNAPKAEGKLVPATPSPRSETLIHVGKEVFNG